MQDNFYLIAQAIVVPAITGLVQALKNAGLPSRYAPIVAAILGGLSSLAWGYDPVHVILGVTMGLASVGLYEISRAGQTPT